jgi:hypothetical protein
VVILFFDDPVQDHATIGKLEELYGAQSKSVVIIRHDQLLNQRQAKQRLSAKFDAHQVATEPMARQMLNVETVLQLALHASIDPIIGSRSLKIDWLLHIDDDELWVCPQPSCSSADGGAKGHFMRLDALGLKQAVYLNHEATYITDGEPEQGGIGGGDSHSEVAEEEEDIFQKRAVFKVNPHLLHTASQLQELQRWKQRSQQQQQQQQQQEEEKEEEEGGEGRKDPLHGALARRYFVSYVHGKAAVRVGAGAAPVDVTLFDVPTGATGGAGGAGGGLFGRSSSSSMSSIGSSSMGGGGGGAAAVHTALLSSPYLLHYVNADAGRFVEKYVNRVSRGGERLDRAPFKLHMRERVHQWRRLAEAAAEAEAAGASVGAEKTAQKVAEQTRAEEKSVREEVEAGEEVEAEEEEAAVEVEAKATVEAAVEKHVANVYRNVMTISAMELVAWQQEGYSGQSEHGTKQQQQQQQQLTFPLLRVHPELMDGGGRGGGGGAGAGAGGAGAGGGDERGRRTREELINQLLSIRPINVPSAYSTSTSANTSTSKRISTSVLLDTDGTIAKIRNKAAVAGKADTANTNAVDSSTTVIGSVCSRRGEQVCLLPALKRMRKTKKTQAHAVSGSASETQCDCCDVISSRQYLSEGVKAGYMT